jgi:hypothetical protein
MYADYHTLVNGCHAWTYEGLLCGQPTKDQTTPLLCARHTHLREDKDSGTDRTRDNARV